MPETRGHRSSPCGHTRARPGSRSDSLAAAIRGPLLAVAGAGRWRASPSTARAEAARLVPELGDVGAASPDSPAAQHRLHDGLANVLAALVAAGARACCSSTTCSWPIPHRWRWWPTSFTGSPDARCSSWRRGGRGDRGRAGALRRSARSRHPARAARPGGRGASWPGRQASGSTRSACSTRPRACRCSSSSTSPRSRIPRTMPSRRVCARSSPRGWTPPARPPRSSSPPPPSSGDRSTSTRSARRPDAARRRRRPGSTSSPGAAFWSSDGGGYEFSHEKLLAVVYEQAGLARRRLLHRRVAEALSSGHGAPALIARHLAAGLDSEAAEAFRRAGDRARSVCAQGGAGGVHVGDRARAPRAGLAARGDRRPAHPGGEYTAAISAYEAAAALGEPAVVAAIEHKLGRVHDRRGDPELAELHLLEALRLGGESPRVQADRSLAAHRRGDGPAAEELAAEPLGLAEAGDDAEAVAQARNILGMLDRLDAAPPGAAASSWPSAPRPQRARRRAQQPRARLAARGRDGRGDGLTSRRSACAPSRATATARRPSTTTSPTSSTGQARGGVDGAPEGGVAIFAEVGDEGGCSPRCGSSSSGDAPAG